LVSDLADLPVTTLYGEQTTFGALTAGKAALVVNVASRCGLTPQYTQLEALQEELGNRGFTVLGFPSNQFGGQEPGTAAEIGAFCQRNYGVTFPMFAKVDVNGDDEHPLFTWLKTERGGVLGSAIKWNFTKFLVGRDGEVIQRYGSTTKPEDLSSDIEAALAQQLAPRA
jgi:glutathione peroxidase